MRTISLLGYYGAGNLGDDLLLAQTINLLQKTENFNFKIWVSNTQEEQFCKSFLAPNIQLINKFSPLDIIASLFDSEALVLGGGSLFQDASSLKSLIYYFVICVLTKLMGKKLIFLSQGIGPLKTVLAKVLTNWAYQMADQITVRDKYSLLIAQNWQISAKYAPDLVWSLELNNKKHGSNKTILISLRPSKHLQTENINFLAQYLKQKFLGYQIYLCPFQKQDQKELEILQKQIPNSFMLDLNQNPNTIFEQIDFCFAMRFHAILLSIKAGIPTIGISYDPKVKALCEEAGLPYLEPQELLEKNLFELNNYQMPSSEQLIEFAQKQAELSERNNRLALCGLLDNI